MRENAEMTHILTPPLKWHGGKHYLASRIVGLMPRHLHYVEPYFGGGAVLLTRDPNDPALWLSPHKGVSEVVNDINGRLVNFWRILRSEADFPRFLRMAQATDRKSTRLNSSHLGISYAVFC